MNVNLYGLFDSLDAAELEQFADEPTPELPVEVSLDNIKRRMPNRKVRAFWWQHAVAVAACACLLIACGFGISHLTNHGAPGTMGTPTFEPTVDSGEQNENPGPTIGNADPVTAIVLRNLEAYEQACDMAVTEDEEALAQYLLGVEGGGAESREDIVEFLDVVESLPIPDIIDGKVILIQYREDAQDATISVMARDGSWIRITYFLYADSNSLEDRYESGEFVNSRLDAPIYSNDNTNSVYNETRAPYPVGSGSEIVWDMQIAGVTAQIYYYTNDAESVDTQSLMQNLKLTNLAMMMK